MTGCETSIAWLALALTPGLGHAGCRRLLQRFGSARAVFSASEKELAEVAGVRRPVREEIKDGRGLRAAEEEADRCRRAGIAIVTMADERYPDLLRHSPDVPLVLFVKGDSGLLAGDCLAVVGARAASVYGLEVAEKYAAMLARAGLTVVSGMAMGIDAAAHRGCLTAGGRTIAVLGCGLDIVYPGQNRELYRRIGESGALVSEYPLGTKPDAFRFPARNRIISGLSLGVLVVEAAKRSGSLITAELALEQGREVFAIPGRVDSPKSAGTHRIVQQGGKLVQCLDDILEELPPRLRPGQAAGDAPASVGPVPLDAAQQRVYDCLDVYPVAVDEIIRNSGFSAARVGDILLHLEMAGLVCAQPGQQYRKST
ncbi:MAG: DNA-processing protein DprA [Thermodesulfobacteriota bacterium]